MEIRCTIEPCLGEQTLLGLLWQTGTRDPCSSGYLICFEPAPGRALHLVSAGSFVPDHFGQPHCHIGIGFYQRAAAIADITLVFSGPSGNSATQTAAPLGSRRAHRSASIPSC